MPPRSWQRLVAELTDQGYQSPYLDRLRQRVDLEQAQADLESELLGEMAAALGRAETKIDAALLQLELLDRELDRLAAAGTLDEARRREFNDRVRAYNDTRERARDGLWQLTIHREALGFRRNEILREFYPIPSPRRPL